MTCIRMILAEDHVLVRQGTRQFLDQEPDFAVVAETGDGAEALALIETLRPDIAILDIHMPGLNAIEVAQRAKAATPDTRILVLTAHDEDNYVVAALEAGVHGYLLKTAYPAELVDAVRAVHSGETVLNPSVAARVIRILMRRQRGGGAPDARDVLTPREREVLRLAALGLRNRDIAEQMGVSSRTVETHFGNILNKLGVSTRTAAVMHAATRKWLPEVQSDQ